MGAGEKKGKLARGMSRYLPEPPSEEELTVEQKHDRHQAELSVKVDEWFAKYDEDNNGYLDRDELTALLVHLHPGTPPPDASLVDELIEKARGSTTEAGATRAALRKVVRRYASYASNQKWIDDLFKKFDADGSGFFEQDELTALLKDTSPDGVVTAKDVAYIWEQCDPNGDGKISREELMPLVAEWKVVSERNMRQRDEREAEQEIKRLMKEEKKLEPKSGLCALL